MSTACPLSELAQVLAAMARSLDQGTALVPSLEKGVETAASPALRQALKEMIESWKEKATILPPVERHKEIFPRTVYWLTAAGFSGGLLETSWAKAAELLEWKGKHGPEKDPARETRRQQALLLLELAALVKAGVETPVALRAIIEDGDALSFPSLPDIHLQEFADSLQRELGY